MKKKRLLADPLTRDQVRLLAACPKCGRSAGEPCARLAKGANHRSRVQAAQGARFMMGVALLEETGRLPNWVR